MEVEVAPREEIWIIKPQYYGEGPIPADADSQDKCRNNMQMCREPEVACY